MIIALRGADFYILKKQPWGWGSTYIGIMSVQREAISLYTHKNNSHLKMLSPPSCCFPPGQLFSSGYEFPPSIYCELASALFPKEMFANQGQIKACELDSKCVFFPCKYSLHSLLGVSPEYSNDAQSDWSILKMMCKTQNETLPP